MSYLQWIQVRSAFVSESRSLGTSLLLMLELCKSDNLLFFTVTPRWLYGRKRATPSPKSRLMNFLVDNGEGGIAGAVLSFLGDVKGGARRDLRACEKAKLLKEGLEMGVIRSELNDINARWWKVKVDGFGKVLPPKVK